MKKIKQIKEKTLDAVFSKWVRNRDKRCLRCGSKLNLQAAHIFSRTARSVRWNPLNAITLCWNCHFNWGHRNPIEFTEFIKKLLGKKFEKLRKEYVTLKHFTEKEKLAILEKYKSNSI